MTEPIIIDGVDVSGCSEYRDLSSSEIKKKYHSISCLGYSVENCKKSDCKDNPNCYYKQLKRKTAECERLKELLRIRADETNKIWDKRNARFLVVREVGAEHPFQILLSEGSCVLRDAEVEVIGNIYENPELLEARK